MQCARIRNRIEIDHQMANSLQIPGFYITTGRWLDAEAGPGQLHKVGHSGDLGRRLTDSAYVTCFPPDHWRYVATFELATKDEAELLEAAVLRCCHQRRMHPRELVRATAAELIALAGAAAEALGLRPNFREAPEYPRPPTTTEPVTALVTEPPRQLACVDCLSLAGPRAEPTNAEPTNAEPTNAEPTNAEPTNAEPTNAEPTNAEPDDFLTEILSWDFDALHISAPTVADVKMVGEPETVPAAEPLAETEDAMFDDLVLELEPEPEPRPVALEMREYQTDAAALCLAELRANGRAILQMACRCGKTPVAYSILSSFFAEGAGAVLFLVPGLSLLRQTAQKLSAYGFAGPMLLVGSDPRPVPLVGGLGAVMTTDSKMIREFLARGTRLVISTYQSSPQVPTDAFALTVFDEAHRVCGGRAPRPFNHTLLAPRVGARLFMTATPAYDPIRPEAISMKDRELFGGVAYRYYLRTGIAAGFVNDFRLQIVAAPCAGDADQNVADQIATAMGSVNKLLVFCRDIAHASRLRMLVQASTAAMPFESLIAHSRLGPGAVVAALRRFGAAGVRAAMFSVRMFQEGVEVPALDAIFFAAPRHSPRDIIQSLCRPLNRIEGKPQSVVFLPITHDPASPPEDQANLKRFTTILPFMDALLDEDPRLYEHLLDPTASEYPVGIIGTHTLGLGASDQARRAALLKALHRVVRYGGSTAARPVNRLLRTECIPWERVFGEIQRIVLTLNRYPKTTDAWVVGDVKVPLHRVYRWAADEYAAWRDGNPSKLEPHQARQLQTLPSWEMFGVEGPYPWGPCMEFLERWLEEHEGKAPMVEVNKGGWIGLDASWLERLSGALMAVNQCDGTARSGSAGNGFVVSAKRQADLERICAKWKLRWRKDRHPDGSLVKDGPPTFIQQAHKEFSTYYKLHGSAGEYIQQYFKGWPQRHLRQENEEVRENKLAPPRIRTGKGVGRKFACSRPLPKVA